MTKLILFKSQVMSTTLSTSYAVKLKQVAEYLISHTQFQVDKATFWIHNCTNEDIHKCSIQYLQGDDLSMANIKGRIWKLYETPS